MLILGAGSRGNAYARAITASGLARIAGVAEPNECVRELFGQRYIWGQERGPREGESFVGWEEWVAWEEKRTSHISSSSSGKSLADEMENDDDGDEDTQTRVEKDNASSSLSSFDVAFVCVLDELHAPVVKALARLGVHILCEKPLATSLDDVLGIYGAVLKGWEQHGRRTVFGIGHVLRYSPHNVLLRKLVREDRVVGNIMSIEHTEPVGWWHFQHSYVR